MIKHTKDELDELHKLRLVALLAYVGGCAHLAKMINVTSATTQSWERRGRVSKKGALLVGSNSRLKTQYPANYLRLDINS